MLIFAPHVVQTFPEHPTRSEWMHIFVKGYLGKKYGVQAAFSRSKGGKVAGSEYLAAASFGVVDVLGLKFNPPPPRPEKNKKKKTEDAEDTRCVSQYVVQGSAKEWSLGCVNSPPAARGSQEAGFTQPRDHSLAQACILSKIENCIG